MNDLIVIGAGAAGMMAGVHAGRLGHQVHILEKNEKELGIGLPEEPFPW